ncbi:Protein [Vibrio sp. B1ASS3]|nr:Protein [Vibrio sp. B1ASS3]CAE6949379.1 Protein [Vibrio sp. B1ASS3]
MGELITEAINNNYLNIPYMCEDGSSPYNCSGVVIRTFENITEDAHPWDYSYIDSVKESMAFSYLRADLSASHLYENPNYGVAGIILKPRYELSSTNFQDYDFYCFFPLDGVTMSREGHGCGDFLSQKKNSVRISLEDEGTCLDKGIITPEDWLSLSTHDQCSFKIHDVERFNIGLETQKKYKYVAYNELVMNLWDINNPNNLPIDAIWVKYDMEGIDKQGLVYAQKAQQDMYSIANRYVPIVRYEYHQRPYPFVFVSDDQVIPAPIQP